MNRKIATVLFFIRLFASIGFGLLYSSLVLFLIQNLHIQDSTALAIVGIFIALHYSLAIINGILAGRWVSYINALIIGVTLQAISVVLIFGEYTNIYLGCSLFLIGSLASSTPINMMITERFEADDHGRERIFMWGYAAMNLGNIIGYSIAGYFQLQKDFKHLYFIAVILMIVALFICLAFKPFLKDLHSKYATFNLKQKVIGSFKYMALLAVLAFIIKQILLYSQITSTFLIVGISCALLLFLYDNCKDNLKNGLIFFVLAIACLLFWSLYFLIPTGLTLFANYNIDRNFFGYVIPPAWLPNINSVLIIFGAPLLGILFKRLDVNHKWTPIRKLLIGLCSMALAFFVLFYGILIAKFELVSLAWVVLAYIFLTFAELFIAPISFASVGKYIARKRQNLMTGVGISILGLGGLIASKLSNLVQINGSQLYSTNKQFFTLFLSLFIFTIVFSLVFFVFKRLILKKDLI